MRVVGSTIARRRHVVSSRSELMCLVVRRRRCHQRDAPVSRRGRSGGGGRDRGAGGGWLVVGSARPGRSAVPSLGDSVAEGEGRSPRSGEPRRGPRGGRWGSERRVRNRSGPAGTVARRGRAHRTDRSSYSGPSSGCEARLRAANSCCARSAACGCTAEADRPDASRSARGTTGVAGVGEEDRGPPHVRCRGRVGSPAHVALVDVVGRRRAPVGLHVDHDGTWRRAIGGVYMAEKIYTVSRGGLVVWELCGGGTGGGRGESGGGYKSARENPGTHGGAGSTPHLAIAGY